MTYRRVGSSPLARRGPRLRGVNDPMPGLIPAGAGRTTPRRASLPGPTAHPRWRGEDTSTCTPSGPGTGSSPLARGGRARCSGRPQSRGAHPRWRGEDVPENGDDASEFGSSPLARGGRRRDQDEAAGLRLIPAGAGRTWKFPAADLLEGSSPLARGGPLRWQNHPRGIRLIPAGAGRTLWAVLRPWWAGAHPRWRGEDTCGNTRSPSVRGSSPLARGGPGVAARTAAREGLIPAGAGRTRRRPPNTGHSWAHPRWRGEDWGEAVSGGVEAGSSPLARGGRVVLVEPHRRDGLIPAGAGRTGVTGSTSPRSWAHPRWRGEDPLHFEYSAFALGSSPLARGGRIVLAGPGDWTRLIPAGAGRT